MQVAAWAFKPLQFKKYSKIAFDYAVMVLHKLSDVMDPGTEKPRIPVYLKIHESRRLLCSALDQGAAGLSAVNSRIQQTTI